MNQLLKKIFVCLFGFSILFLFSLGARAQIKPWNEITSPSRFQPLTFSGGNVILDRESGIIYDASPSPLTVSWAQAMANCSTQPHAGIFGWRLANVEELSNLINSSYPGDTIGGAFTWTSTSDPSDSNNAYRVTVGGSSVQSALKTIPYIYICVRGE